MGLYFRPATQQEALEALAGRSWTVLAGATDLYPTHGDAPHEVDALDISALHAPISRDAAYWYLPASVTWSELLAAPLPAAFDGLKQAARQIGGRQIQNVGTVMGNVCNASPAADGIPCLLALDAEVTLASLLGVRHVPIGGFVVGPRATARAADELAVGLRIPVRAARSVFLKLGARRYLVISIAAVALNVELAEGRIVAARLAVGACGPVATRVAPAEAALIGHPPDPARLGPEMFETLAPIDDIRATAAYRRAAVVTLARRAVAALA